MARNAVAIPAADWKNRRRLIPKCAAASAPIALTRTRYSFGPAREQSMRIRTRSGDEHAPEANPVFHHPGQRGFCLIELEGLRARANARQRAERHRLFGIDRASARPARHGPSA